MKDGEDRQRRLLALIGPLHDRARMTARRLCRSHADGDDLFHEAVLRALDHLDELRDAGTRGKRGGNGPMTEEGVNGLSSGGICVQVK